MSAFIVSDETISAIVQIIQIVAPGQDGPDTFRRLFSELIPADMEERPRRFAHALIDLNTRAVNGRYGTRHKPHKVTITWPKTSRIDRLKALDQLIYQCSEDTAIDDPLLAALNKLQSELAMRIIRETPDFLRSRFWTQREAEDRPGVQDFPLAIDFELARTQKSDMAEVIARMEQGLYQASVDEIGSLKAALHILDAIQDHAVDKLGFPEDIVFGPSAASA